jgi:hypothetical protein
LGRRDLGFTEERVHSIFEDLDQFLSSKRNLFKLNRGLQGDALKEEEGIPTALASKYNKGKAWNEPLIIRNGFGQEFEIRIVLDKINGRNYSKIRTKQTNNITNITEVEIRIPYDEDIINLEDIKNVLIKYALLNTHTSFHFNLVDYIDKSNPFEAYRPYEITLPATQKMFISSTSYKKLTKIYHFDLSTFENLLYSIEDKGLIIYDDILQAHFKEGHWVNRDDDLFVPVGQLQRLSKQQSEKKILAIFQRLRCARANDSMALGPSMDDLKTKRDMLPFHSNERREALKQRVEQLGYTVKGVKYKVEVGYNYSDYSQRSNIHKSTTDTCVPYIVEVAVIHTEDYPEKLLYCEGINASPNHYNSFTYTGFYHHWFTKGGAEKQAVDAHDLLRQCGYSNDDNCKREKERSIVLLNLWSPKLEFTDYGKSSINFNPFEETVIDSLSKLCSYSNKPRDDKGKILETKAIMTDFIINRYKKVLLDPELKIIDSWKTSTPVYRVRPILERHGLYPTRQYLQGLVRTICNEIPEMHLVRGTQSYHFVYTGNKGVSREVLGIYEATRAYIYFRGRTYDVSFRQLENLKSLATFILIIEKEGVVELLTHWADLHGVALCYTRGFITDNAEKFSKLATKEGARILLLTDNDFSGWAMWRKIPNIHRIGITLETLRILGIPLNDDIAEDLPRPKGTEKKANVTYLNSKHAAAAKEMYENGLISEEDWKFVRDGKYGRRIEIDNVIAASGAERFWKEFIIASYRERFDDANYTLSLNRIDFVTLPNQQRLNGLIEKYNKAVVTKDEVADIDSEYSEYDISTNGLIEDIQAEEDGITARIKRIELQNEHNLRLEAQLALIIEEFEGNTKDAISKSVSEAKAGAENQQEEEEEDTNDNSDGDNDDFEKGDDNDTVTDDQDEDGGNEDDDEGNIEDEN